jgi:Fic family protein
MSPDRRRSTGQTVTPAKGETLALVQRIRAEYVEMPGLSLTVLQAARFWGLSARTLERVLSSLVESGFLQRDTKGCYRRSL